MKFDNNKRTLEEIIENMDIVASCSTYPKETLINYFYDKTTDIENCFENEAVKNSCIEALKDLICNEIKSSLPLSSSSCDIDNKGYVITSSDPQHQTQIRVILSKDYYSKIFCINKHVYRMKIMQNGDMEIHFPSIYIKCIDKEIQINYPYEKMIKMYCYREIDENIFKQTKQTIRLFLNFCKKCELKTLINCEKHLYKQLLTINDNVNNLINQEKGEIISNCLNNTMKACEKNNNIDNTQYTADDQHNNDNCWHCGNCCGLFNNLASNNSINTVKPKNIDDTYKKRIK